MTEYEMAYLVNDMRMGFTSSLSLFFGILTAFLVASYVAAHKLTRTMATIVVGLFTLCSLLNFASIGSQLRGLAGLAREMRNFAQTGKGLAWHPGASVSDDLIALSVYLMHAVLVVAIFASIYFFFHCRRVNRKAESSAWHPKV